ncbi:MAG: TerB family tellurite resistance protein [Bacteroidales bacterium]|nr:TerB family tellurite resistance protein [Bacteroidales bacterium]
MGYRKWLGGVLGWVVLGPIGALIGFTVGAAADIGQSATDEKGRPSSAGSLKWTGQRNSFLVSFLVFSAAIIKADGKFLKSELDYVKDFIRRSFGEQAVPEAMDILKGLKDKEINIYEVGGQIKQYMNYSQRMQLLHYLVGLAQCDGDVCSDELKMLREIAAAIGVNTSDSESIFSMFGQNLESAYSVLEIDKNANDDQVKRAYKRLAIKHHPDKVASLGPDVQKAAEEKFKKIQMAYEKIKKERGIV